MFECGDVVRARDHRKVTADQPVRAEVMSLGLAQADATWADTQPLRTSWRPVNPLAGEAPSDEVKMTVCEISQRRRSKGSERVALAIRHDIVRATRGRPLQWILVRDIAQRLGLADEVVEAAVEAAIERGWFIGKGDPLHSVSLALTEMQGLS
jgi:hypothetical protein